MDPTQPRYPLEEHRGTSCGTKDLSIRPLEARYRKLIPRSRRKISLGAVERLPFGTLRCFLRKRGGQQLAVVGLYKGRRCVGKELWCVPTQAELEAGAIAEWRFDAQHVSIFGTAWDFTSTDLWFWTVRSLRSKGTIERSRNLG